MQSDFDKAFGIIVGVEAGYVNNPKDPGGETNWGITWTTLRTAIDKGLVEAVTTIKSLTQDQSKKIYKTLYWDMVKGDLLPAPMCIFAFDSAVNQGIEPTIKMMQRALDHVQDGILGVTTMNAVEKATEWHCARFMSFRAQRYTSTRNADQFLTGWLTRTYVVAIKVGKPV